MSDLLDGFLTDHAARPWAWGSVDCCLSLADWAVANGHVDPAATWRGTYSDEIGCRQIVIARGGLVPLVSDVCARAGLQAASAPARGDVGVIGTLLNVNNQFGAIFDGERWQVRSPQGFGPVIAKPLGMWRV